LGVEGRQAPRGAPLIEDLDHPLHRGLRISDGALRAADRGANLALKEKSAIWRWSRSLRAHGSGVAISFRSWSTPIATLRPF
jgi:hypothetical protein